MKLLSSTVRAAAIGLVITGASTVAFDAHAQTSDRSRFFHWLYRDAASLTVQLGMSAPLAAAAGAGVLVPAAQVDTRVLAGVQSGYREPLASFLRASNELGGPSALPAVAGVFAVSLATNDAKFQDAAFTSLQSLVFAGSITGGLKMIFGRYRPDVGDGAYRFDSFSGHASFPSGHTTAAFAIVTPWVMYYPNVATYGLFAVSTGTAVARIALDKHWPTDVLAGAAIGFLTARFLTNRHRVTLSGAPRIDVSPAVTRFGSGFRVQLRLS